MKKKVYISGQITGLELAEAHSHFSKIEELLITQGHEPFNPMKLVPFEPGKLWQEYMKEDIKILLDCDAIFMLPNWVKSKGAQFELQLALTLGLEVIY